MNHVLNSAFSRYPSLEKIQPTYAGRDKCHLVATAEIVGIDLMCIKFYYNKFQTKVPR